MLVDEIVRWGYADFGPPASADAIAACEAELGVALPDHLRQVLAEADGIEGEYGLGLLWSTRRIADENRRFRNDNGLRELYMPFTGLAFFADAGNGDRFAVSLHGNHEVYAWNHEDDSRIWVAPTVMHYLEHWITGTLTI